MRTADRDIIRQVETGSFVVLVPAGMEVDEETESLIRQGVAFEDDRNDEPAVEPAPKTKVK